MALCGVKDLSYIGEKFTWVNKQDGHNFIQERLDRFVGDIAWRFVFPRANISNLFLLHLDHWAIKVTLGGLAIWVHKVASKM